MTQSAASEQKEEWHIIQTEEASLTHTGGGRGHSCFL
ncbi:hypothetical protein CBFG_06248, partial [Clostridiales bacterium 1_7_47FAA]